MKIFEYSDEDLPKVCIEAEFNSDSSLKIDEDNVVRENGIILFKRPICINSSELSFSILDQTAIVKRSSDRKHKYIFALGNTENSYDVLSDLYYGSNMEEKGYEGQSGFPTGWESSVGLFREVK